MAQHAFSQHPENGSWNIRRHDITRTPASIFGGPPQALRLQGATPEARAAGFFTRHKQMFGIRPAVDRLEVERTRERRGFAYTQFKQYYKSVPVYTGGYKVTMTRQGSLRMISGQFFPGIDVNVEPRLSAAQAARVAVEAVSSGSLMSEPEAELIVYPGEGRYALAYVVRVAVGSPPEDWRVIVDAQSGKVLKTENITMHIASAVADDVTGAQQSSPPANAVPLTTTGSGKVYLDNPNDGSTSTEDLPRLEGSGSNLYGTYVDARNYDGSDASPTSGSSTYYFSDSNTHFDEVNLYYHVDRYADHMPSINFSGLGRTIEAYAHYGSSYNNAFYDVDDFVGNGKQLYFGDGDGVIFRDFAKENDVIYHEFTHGVLDHLGIGYNTYPAETGALQEGTSDYLAASFSGNPRIGQWVTICTDTGDLRTVSNSSSTFNYGNRAYVEYAYCDQVQGDHLAPIENRYSMSMIWSGGLWDLRGALNANTVDELVIEAFNRVSGTPDFQQARDAIVQADNDLNSGSNTCTIKNTLAGRGIGSACAPPPPPLEVSISGPSHLSEKEWGTFVANASNGSGTYTYDWYARYPGDDFVLSYETSDTYQRSDLSDFELKVVVHDGGNTASGTKYVSVGLHIFPQKERSPLETATTTALAPDAFTLASPAPNPVRSRATVRYGLPEAAEVEVSVYDVMGRRVARLASGSTEAGWHTARFEAAGLPAGVYLVRMRADSFATTKRVVLVR